MSDLDCEQPLLLDGDDLDCFDVQSLVDSYVEGKLTADINSKLESHTAICEKCSHLVQDIKRLVLDARELSKTPMPDGVQARLRNALKERVGYSESLD